MSNSRDLTRFAAFVLTMFVATLLQTAGPPDVAGRQAPAADGSLQHLAALEQRIVAAAEKAKRSVVRIAWFNNRAKSDGSCSGVILTADGYVVTGAFSFLERGGVSSGQVVSIHLADGRCTPGVAVGLSWGWDLGLIKITQDGQWPSAEVGSSRGVEPGEVCLALGYPPAVRVGQLPYDRRPSLRVGRVTTTGLTRWLGTSCRIDRSGDKGGGLFDLDGRLIGIHSHYHSQDQMTRHSTIEIINTHWKELAGRKPAAEGRVGGRHKETGQSLDKIQPPPVPAPDDPRLAPAVAKARRATVAIEGPDLDMSGVLVSPDGYIVTCAHHRKPRGTAATIHLADGRAALGELLGRHPLLDVGLAKITAPGPWPHTQMGSAAAVKPGDLCLALGYPTFDDDGLRRPRWHEVVVRVSRIRDTSFVEEELWSSCELWGGDSGGGLFDSQGRLIGVHIECGPDSLARQASIDLVKKHWDLLVKGSPAEDPVPFDRSPTAEAFRNAVRHVPPLTVEVLSDERRHRKRRALGTIVSSDGHILTKASELRGSVFCRMPDDRTLPATVSGVSREHDLALLKIEAAGLPQIGWSRREEIPMGSFVGALTFREPAAVGVVALAPREVARAAGTLVLGEVKDATGGVEIIELRGIWRLRTPLRKGDVILHVEGRPTPDVKTFEALTDQDEVGIPFVFAGDPIRVGIRRSGKEMQLRFPLLSPTHDGLGTTSLRSSGFPAVFDTDADVKKDCCGGPIVDRLGKVVGISIAVPTEGRVYVVPAAIARRMAESKTPATSPQSGIGES